MDELLREAAKAAKDFLHAQQDVRVFRISNAVFGQLEGDTRIKTLEQKVQAAMNEVVAVGQKMVDMLRQEIPDVSNEDARIILTDRLRPFMLEVGIEI